MAQESSSSSVTRIPVEAFAGQCRRHLTVLTANVSYFEAVTLDAEQKRQFLREPVEGIPRPLIQRLPPLRILLVPYLEKGPAGSTDVVCFEKPAAPRLLTRAVFDVKDELFLLFGVEGQDVADYHYWLFNTIADHIAGSLREGEWNQFSALVLDELNRGTRGEVDEASLQAKAKVQRRQPLPGRNTKLMREYLRSALVDTLTLYLHGLCCDIDVEPGPRQLGSRYLKARLELLAEFFPPNAGYLLFPAPAEAAPPSPAE